MTKQQTEEQRAKAKERSAAYYQKNKEKWASEYYGKHRKAKIEYAIAWIANNRQRFNAAARARYWKNLDKHRSRAKEAQRKHRLKDPAGANAASARWRRRYPDKVSEACQVRRGLMMGALIGNLQEIRQWHNSWKHSTEVICHWCLGTFTGAQCHADHVVPLVLGGAHSLENLVVACASCNQRKRALSPEQWLSKLGRTA